MATRTWVGGAVAVKDVWTITVANTWATGDTGTVTINGKDLTVTIGANTSTAQVATSIKQAWESETLTDTTASVSPSGGGTTIGEHSQLTATVSGSTVILTADVAGRPSPTITVSENTAGSGTLSITNTTAATGPNHWNNADNWDEGSVPTTGDDVIIDRPVNILYGLNASGDTLASMTIGPRFTASIGLPFHNTNNASYPYDEALETRLRVGVTTLNCYGASGRIKLNTGSVATTINVYSTGTATETGRAAFQFIGTDNTNVVNVYGGDVGIAANNGEAATVATLRQTAGTVTCGTGATLTTVFKAGGTMTVASSTTTLTNRSGSLTVTGGTATLLIAEAGTVALSGTTTATTLRIGTATVTSGPNVTLTTVTKDAGTLTADAGIGTLTQTSGTTTVGSGNITTANINGGTFNYRGSGTITTLNVRDCIVDFGGATASCTVTTINLNARPVTLKDPASRVTWTNGLPTGYTIKYTAA